MELMLSYKFGKVLESIGFGPTTIKTEYMECKLSNRNKSEEVARLDG